MRGSSRRSVARNSLQSLVSATLPVCSKYYCSVHHLCLWTLYCLLVLPLLVCGQSWERYMLMSVHSIQSVYFELSRSSFCEDGLSIMVTLQYLYALQGLSHPPGFPVPWMFGPYDLSQPLDCLGCGSRRGPCMPPVVGRSIFCLVLQHSDFLVRIHSCHIK